MPSMRVLLKHSAVHRWIHEDINRPRLNLSIFLVILFLMFAYSGLSHKTWLRYFSNRRMLFLILHFCITPFLLPSFRSVVTDYFFISTTCRFVISTSASTSKAVMLSYLYAFIRRINEERWARNKALRNE